MSGPAVEAASVREAGAGDAAAVAAAVGALLEELGGSRLPAAELEAEARRLLADPQAGLALLAEAGGKTVGLLAASWQRALHVPGRYATIQDLWVAPEWRSRGTGAALVEALAARCRELGVPRIEVGLPRRAFAAFARTEAFYRGAGFEEVGPRMRRLL